MIAEAIDAVADLAIAAFIISVAFLMTVDWIHQDAHHPET